MNGDKIMDAIGMIDEELIAEAKKHVKKRFGAKKVFALVAALIIIFAFGITSFAKVNNADFYDVLYFVFPSVAQRLKPINLSCEDNGIKMEVVSADVKEKEAYIYVSLQDLIGGRIDETVDLYDSYHLRLMFPFSQHGSCNKIGYDKETKTATFLIHIVSDEENLSGKKFTFSMNCFISQRVEQEGFIDEINLSEAELKPEIEAETHRYKKLKDKYEPGSLKNKIYWFAYERIPRVIKNFLNLNENYFEYEFYAEETEKYLAGSGEIFYTSETGAEFVSMGFIDNKLHIKVYYGNRHYNDHIGFLSVYNKNGREIHASDMKYIDNFGEIEPNYFAPMETWVDYTFDISPDEIEGCRLYGEFRTHKNYTEGNWEVTFRLP